jgi:hypothetical protein
VELPSLPLDDGVTPYWKPFVPKLVTALTLLLDPASNSKSG